jgi:hypothetical protein
VGPDPDPHESALILVGWIRIQEGKNGPQKQKKSEETLIFKRWLFSIQG